MCTGCARSFLDERGARLGRGPSRAFRARTASPTPRCARARTPRIRHHACTMPGRRRTPANVHRLRALFSRRARGSSRTRSVSRVPRSDGVFDAALRARSPPRAQPHRQPLPNTSKPPFPACGARAALRRGRGRAREAKGEGGIRGFPPSQPPRKSGPASRPPARPHRENRMAPKYFASEPEGRAQRARDARGVGEFDHDGRTDGQFSVGGPRSKGKPFCTPNMWGATQGLKGFLSFFSRSFASLSCTTTRPHPHPRVHHARTTEDPGHCAPAARALSSTSAGLVSDAVPLACSALGWRLRRRAARAHARPAYATTRAPCQDDGGPRPI
jgi:hypothetical protein